uniref:Uncharacterized protein n=1 Tax=Leptocylindrus danicus TaxID=163516 RepID=A0A7S2K8V5_9STRA|eukprot:CAMPEP_0116020232 /NCGR_PEP_ID=MMETSP0321-20121206/9681_1 /TAXON_ID=163516 /ORGANISM="Leptocylindrus danicus var. danicus, Strain B650" /LENGTH=212 /DNA_ID=CAMNT_0003490897 /DNA_START=66 /DNA_END=704 /DNA_ORIENTATION=+
MPTSSRYTLFLLVALTVSTFNFQHPSSGQHVMSGLAMADEAATDVQTDEEESSYYEKAREAIQEAREEIRENVKDAIEEVMADEEEAEEDIAAVVAEEEEEIDEEPEPEPEPEPETTEVAETPDEEEATTTSPVQKAISDITSNIQTCFTSTKATFMDLKERVVSDKDVQQKVKKAAAFSLGAWGAVAGGNWIYQRAQSDDEVAPAKGKGRR